MAHPHDLAWQAPAPLWSHLLAEGEPPDDAFTRPALLGFASDAFMDRLNQILDNDPALLEASWERSTTETATDVIKLFQPIHGRFYLLAASLVCRTHGLPDRALDPARDRFAFVVRQLLTNEASGEVVEQGWIGDAENGGWRTVSEAEAPAPDEDLLPLFPLAYQQENQQRRLLLGLVPVDRRALYRKQVDQPKNRELGETYQARCVYWRPACTAFKPPTVSRPSLPFAFAAFHDDQVTRQVRRLVLEDGDV